MQRSIRVLHVDDEPDFAETVAEFLQRETDRIEFVPETSVSDGLTRLSEEAIDCIISDFEMCGENGIEFLEQVREEYPDLPFIMYTGKGNETVASDAISAGVTEYLQKKPVSEDSEVLINRITNAVEKRRAEEKLERQNDLFEKAQDIASVGAWEYDVQTGNSIWTTELRQLHGVDEEFEPTPENAVEFYHPDDREMILEHFERAVENGVAYDIEARLVTRSGKQRWVRTRADPQTENGSVVRLRGTVQDITERKRREQEQKRKNERLDEFASVISHDLRNPLNVAQSRSTLLAEDVQSEHLPPLRNALDRMESIIEDTLTLAREGDTVSETEQIGITNLIGHSWQMVKTDEATLEIADEFTIQGDRQRVRHVFENLLRNAIEHGGDDVNVTVGAMDDGFYVADDGAGIPEDRRQDVFETGYSTSDTGTGFGLSIVQQITEAHDWEIAVTESREGGARFEITGVT